jgi:hypothetical protein
MIVAMSTDENRRDFLVKAAATAAAFTIVPRHVLGGPGVVAPSDKITLGYIGVGTQGLREMMNLLPSQDIQIVSICDVNKEANGYLDWSRTGILSSIRRRLDKPDWFVGNEGVIPGGRDVAQDIVETYYSTKRSGEKFKGCSTYADFRELLDKEKDLNAVKIMTPDHLHGVISIAAMRKGKHVVMHKPLSNRLNEGRLVSDTARETGVATYFVPWDAAGDMTRVMGWINDGSIGTLREVHNWSARPMWPQYATIPASTPPVPRGFDWDLWLGPEADRPYSPHYTHMVFRGWYDFGGGSMADMGHYSLWTVFNHLELANPVSIEPMLSHACVLRDTVAVTVENDYSFPTASVVRFRYPERAQRPAIDLVWYDGGMHPPLPEELDEDRQDLPEEGMMFVGDKGKILAGFNVQSPRLIPEKRMSGLAAPEEPAREHPQGGVSPGMQEWIAACRGGKQPAGSFLNAWPITEAVNLYGVALRTRKRLLYDAENRKITNDSNANRYLAREYRSGWDPKGA